jgi:dephospho-CoA kinase
MTNKTWHRDVVALTGTIGSGKSTASRYFEDFGAHIINADRLARIAVSPGSNALKQIATEFGAQVIAADGNLDRKTMGEIVFADAGKRRRLEEITHPVIQNLAQQRFSEAENKYPLIIYDCPLLFESGLDKQGFKSIVVVTAPQDLCLSRIMQRDNISRADAESRFRSQLPEQEKIAKSDFVINNSGSLMELQQGVAKVYQQLVSQTSTTPTSSNQSNN